MRLLRHVAAQWVFGHGHRGFMGAIFFDRVLTNALDIYLLHIPSDFALLHYIHHILCSRHYNFTETHEMLCGTKSFISLWHKLSWVQHLSWMSSDFWRPQSNWALADWAMANWFPSNWAPENLAQVNWAPGKLCPWCFCQANCWFTDVKNLIPKCLMHKYRNTNTQIH